MQKRDINGFSDKLLEYEILAAERRVAEASHHMRHSRRNVSDAGGNMLMETLATAHAYEAALLSERSRRRAVGKYDPTQAENFREVVIKPRRASIGMANLESKRCTDSVSLNEEVELVPIIVFENGFPRAWRKGDPIY